MKSKYLMYSLIALSIGSVLQCQENDNDTVPQLPTAPAEISPTIGGDINIGLSAAQRENVGKILNTLLANEYTLYVKTQNYHWNVSGPLFGPLHTMFQNQYEMLAKIIDTVAERALSIGVPAQGTLTSFMQKSQLTEEPGVIPDANTMILNLLNDHESIIRTLRIELQKASDTYKDMGTNNFLTDLLEKHEKIAWMLRSSLEKK